MDAVVWISAIALSVVVITMALRWTGMIGRAPDRPASTPSQQRAKRDLSPPGRTEYAGLDPTYVLIGAPVVPGLAGDVPLREWLRHEHPSNDHVWRDVVAEFYGRAAQDPEIAAYFSNADMETLQRHFLATLLLVSGNGLTVGAVRQMRERHKVVSDEDGRPISERAYDKTMRILLEVLRENGVPPSALTQVFAVLAPLRQAIIGQARHA
jgi:truncated hemoglobin YjbI